MEERNKENATNDNINPQADNLIDLALLVFALLLVPLGYGAYLLFRTPAPQLLGVTPNPLRPRPPNGSRGSAVGAKRSLIATLLASMREASFCASSGDPKTDAPSRNGHWAASPIASSMLST